MPDSKLDIRCVLRPISSFPCRRKAVGRTPQIRGARFSGADPAPEREFETTWTHSSPQKGAAWRQASCPPCRGRVHSPAPHGPARPVVALPEPESASRKVPHWGRGAECAHPPPKATPSAERIDAHRYRLLMSRNSGQLEKRRCRQPPLQGQRMRCRS